MNSKIFHCLFFALCIQNVVPDGEIVISIKSPPTIYDQSNTFEVKGSGFKRKGAGIVNVEISAVGQNPLRIGEDFFVSANRDSISLTLSPGSRWHNFQNDHKAIPLIISWISYNTSENSNLLHLPAIVAYVIPTPYIFPREDIIFQTSTKNLTIYGKGLIGVRKIRLYGYLNSLYEHVHYEFVSSFPLENNFFTLRLKGKHKWRYDPGYLRLGGIDTGGGVLMFDAQGDGPQSYPVIIALVQADIRQDSSTGPTVIGTSVYQLIYHDEPTLIISGTGFNPKQNILKFLDTSLPDASFTTLTCSNTEITLRLSESNSWRNDMENLPGALTLLAIDTGKGYRALGSDEYMGGIAVATVFETPLVFSSQDQLHMTLSSELLIRGSGFHDLLQSVQLEFDPPLEEGLDHSITVLSRTELLISLFPYRRWSASAGPLYVTHVNTRGDAQGWIALPVAGVQVAEVITSDMPGSHINIEYTSFSEPSSSTSSTSKEIPPDSVSNNTQRRLEDIVINTVDRMNTALAADESTEVIELRHQLSVSRMQLLAFKSLTSHDMALKSLEVCYNKIQQYRLDIATGLTYSHFLLTQAIEIAASRSIRFISILISKKIENAVLVYFHDSVIILNNAPLKNPNLVLNTLILFNEKSKPTLRYNWKTAQKEYIGGVNETSIIDKLIRLQKMFSDEDSSHIMNTIKTDFGRKSLYWDFILLGYDIELSNVEDMMGVTIDLWLPLENITYMKHVGFGGTVQYNVYDTLLAKSVGTEGVTQQKSFMSTFAHLVCP